MRSVQKCQALQVLRVVDDLSLLHSMAIWGSAKGMADRRGGSFFQKVKLQGIPITEASHYLASSGKSTLKVLEKVSS